MGLAAFSSKDAQMLGFGFAWCWYVASRRTASPASALATSRTLADSPGLQAAGESCIPQDANFLQMQLSLDSALESEASRGKTLIAVKL